MARVTARAPVGPAFRGALLSGVWQTVRRGKGRQVGVLVWLFGFFFVLPLAVLGPVGMLYGVILQDFVIFIGGLIATGIAYQLVDLMRKRG